MLTMGMDFNYQAAHAWFINLDRYWPIVIITIITFGSSTGISSSSLIFRLAWLIKLDRQVFQVQTISTVLGDKIWLCVFKTTLENNSSSWSKVRWIDARNHHLLWQADQACECNGWEYLPLLFLAILLSGSPSQRPWAGLPMFTIIEARLLRSGRGTVIWGLFEKLSKTYGRCVL